MSTLTRGSPTSAPGWERRDAPSRAGGPAAGGEPPSPGGAVRVVRGGAADAALAAVTIAAVCGFGRVFGGGTWLPPLLIVAVAGHLVAWASRRRGVGPVAAAALSGVGLIIIVSWVIEPHTLTLGLPLAGTWDAVSRDLSEAWQRFGVVRAPAEPIRGFLLAAAVATWLTAFLADSFAFRFRARLEALLPSFVLFMFAAMLGTDRNRVALAALYLGAVLTFAVLSGVGQTAPGAWLGGRAAEGQVALVRRGLTMAFLVLLGGLAIGPNLPGAEDSPLLNWRETKKRRPSSRVTPSPLVEIRSRLVQPSGAEVFTVRSNVASYWRLTSLDRFDGSIWSSLGSYRTAGEQLPSDIAAGDAVQLVDQHFEIRALASIWLPAAYQPERLDGPPGVRYDRDSSSLITEAASSDGLRYRVSSTQRRPTADDLRRASPTVPDDVRDRYLALPANFPERVKALAVEVAGADTTPFEAARALQDWFRSSFTYDLNVVDGHGEEAIERFLFDVKRGYCEQFAGAYAAMARSLGLPARVAVGFTPGPRTADGVFHVTDANAHAWPEVYIAGFGWTAFEPTPNRSVPDGESYTGVPPLGQETVPTTVPGAPATTPATTAPAPVPGDDQALETNASGAGDSGPQGRVVAAGAVLLLAGLYAGGVPLGHRMLRARRRTAAVAGEDRVLLAWQEAQDDLAVAGLPRRRHETASEYAERAATDGALIADAGPGAAEALGQLAADSSVAAFAPTGAHDDVARRAEKAAATIHEVVRERATPWQKLQRALDPRPLKELLPYSSFLKRLRRRLPASPK